jgi:hypothetical protein
MVKIKNQKDFFSGLLFMGLGIAFGCGALGYKLGDAGRMGPGYFPLLLGSLMAILGVVIAFKALVVKAEGDDRIGSWAWRPLVFVLCSNLVFGLLLGGLPSIKLPPAGLIAGIYGLTVIASLAERRFNSRDVLILATILAGISYAAFIALLKLLIPVWPDFMAG